MRFVELRNRRGLPQDSHGPRFRRGLPFTRMSPRNVQAVAPILALGELEQLGCLVEKPRRAAPAMNVG